MALSAQIGGADFDGLLGLIGAWPAELQFVGVSVLSALLAYVVIKLKGGSKPSSTPTPAAPIQNHAISALAESIQKAGAATAEAHRRANDAEASLREVCNAILAEPPQDIDRLREVARKILGDINDRRR